MSFDSAAAAVRDAVLEQNVLPNRLEQINAFESRRWLTPLELFLGQYPENDESDDADWVLCDVIPRQEPCLLAGPPKSGKTWCALDIAISIAAGADWLGHQNTLGRPANVLVIALEDCPKRLAKRVRRLLRGRGLAAEGVQATLRISTESLRFPKGLDFAALKSEIASSDDWTPEVVIIDSLTRVMTGNPNDTEDAAEFTAAWSQLCRDTGAAVCFIHHTRKQGAGAASQALRAPLRDEIRGSGDFVAQARHIVTIAADAHGNMATHASGNLGEDREGFLRMEEVAVDGATGMRLVAIDQPLAGEGKAGADLAVVSQAVLAVVGAAGEPGLGAAAIRQEVREWLATHGKKGVRDKVVDATVTTMGQSGQLVQDASKKWRLAPP